MGHAPELEALYQTYKDRGFIVMTLLSEDENQQPADLEYLQEWANRDGLTFPVLQDLDSSEILNYVRADPNFSGGYGLPTMQLISPGMKVEIVNSYVGVSEIEAHLTE